MNFRLYGLILLCLFQAKTGTALVQPARFNPDTQPSLSARRITELTQLIRETSATAEVAEKADSLQLTVLDKFAAQTSAPLQPVLPLLVLADCKKIAAEKAARIALDQYPQLDLPALTKQAETMFPLVEPGQKVTLTYQINPGNHPSISGIFKGKIGDAIIIDSHKILLRDLLPPPPREKLISQFDENATAQMRREYIARQTELYEERRQDFIDQEVTRILVNEKAQAVIENERRGYVWYENAWRSPAAIVAMIFKEQSLRPPPPATRVSPKPQPKPSPLLNTSTPPPPAPILDNKGGPLNQATESKALEQPGDSRPQITPDDVIIAAAIQEENLADDDNDIALDPNVNEIPRTDPGPAPVSPSKTSPPSMTGPVASPHHSFVVPNLQQFITVILLLLFAIGAWGVSHYLTREKSISRFYTEREDAEKDFWTLTEVPDTKCAFVAFKFADYTQAYRAISRLSYINQKAPNQPMKSSLPIHFGIYPQADDEFIAFVGGEQLTLPAWREAWAMFVNTEDSAEYRVSDPPDTKLDIPNKFLSQNASSLTFARDYDGTDGDFSHYVIFTGQSKAIALTFLKLFRQIKTGIHIIVETPDGHWGRDDSGIYRE